MRTVKHNFKKQRRESSRCPALIDLGKLLPGKEANLYHSRPLAGLSKRKIAAYFPEAIGKERQSENKSKRRPLLNPDPSRLTLPMRLTTAVL